MKLHIEGYGASFHRIISHWPTFLPPVLHEFMRRVFKWLMVCFVLAGLVVPQTLWAHSHHPRVRPVETKVFETKVFETKAAETHWVTAWASAQMLPDAKNSLATEDLHDVTLRQIVRVSLGGQRVRLHISNAFGTTPLTLNAVTVATANTSGTPEIGAGTALPVTFSGHSQVTIPPGADYVSDAVNLPVSALSFLSVSLWQTDVPEKQTSHPGSRTTSYVVHGNHVMDERLVDAKSLDHWFEISAVDVDSATSAGAIVLLGDSITDGYGVTTNSESRWPDALMTRFANKGLSLSVLNLGIGGNRLLLDGLGPNALARFDRDVVSLAGVRYLVVFEGVNDLGTATRDAPLSEDGHQALVDRMTASYQQLIDQAHAHGIRVIGATISPFGGNSYYHPDASNEADRQRINAWIRAPGHFDDVIDFDQLLKDPAHPEQLLTQFDSGDHLHPTPGYTAMGNFVDLKIFK